MVEIFKLFFDSYTFRVVTIGCTLLGVFSAIIGTFAMLKKESLLGDGISHASLAGVCVAFLITGKKDLYILLLGALIIGLICLYLIFVIQQKSKVKFDNAIALLLSTFFGLGLVLLSYLKKVPGAKKAGLNKFIFGQASTLVVKDIYLIITVGFIIIILTFLFWKEIKISIFDPSYARTLGIKSDRINFLISSMIVVNVIIGIQIAGVILITAMLILPPVCARLWSDRLFIVVLLSSFIGGISGASGSIISTLDSNLPTGPLIIVVSGIFFLFSLLFSKKGIIAKNYKIYKRNKNIKNNIPLSNEVKL